MSDRAFSLAITLGIVVVLALLAMVSLATVLADVSLTGGIYSQGVTMNAAESGVHQSSPVLLEDAESNFTTVLTNNGGQVLVGSLNYPQISGGAVDFTVTVRDNDDLDGDESVDNDSRLIVNSVGVLQSGGRTEIEVLIKYIGTDTEYAQETGGSKSNSSFSSEVDVEGGMNEVMDGG